MASLTVVIITKNEENNIGACIDAVKSIADEIVVLDSFSTDRTEEICLQKSVRFMQHAFEGHIQQKNRAKDLATGDWIFSLDADEQPDQELLQQIVALKNSGLPNCSGFTMKRLNFYCGKPIKTCGWYPDAKLRIWKNGCGTWTGVNPHDRFELSPNQSQKHLSGNILHNTYPTHEAMVQQAKKFAQIAATQLALKPWPHLLVKMVFSPLFKFMRNYFFKRGILDGIAGLQICRYQAWEVFTKYRKALSIHFKA